MKNSFQRENLSTSITASANAAACQSNYWRASLTEQPCKPCGSTSISAQALKACAIAQETLHEVVTQFGTLEGNKLSEVTHRFGPWSWVWDPLEPCKEIPYSLFRWLDNIDLTDVDAQLALKSLKRPLARGALKELQSH